MQVRPPAQWRFLAAATSLFAMAAVASILMCQHMAKMGEMSMPGGWTMSMMWMRMPGQSWPGIACAFMAMWTVMMIAMMLPVLAPVLVSYRRALAHLDRRCVNLATLAIGTGYFAAWTAFGLIIFAAGALLVGLQMRQAALASTVPTIGALSIIAAGLLQLSAWKMRQLHCCHQPLAMGLAKDLVGPWNSGLRLGVRCVQCCAPLMTILLALGMMDLHAMTLVTIVTALERTHRVGHRAAQAIGVIAIATGAWILRQTIV